MFQSLQRQFKVIYFVCIFVCVLFACSQFVGEKPELKEVYFPKLSNYADLYLRGTYDVLHMIRVRELGKIGQACKIGAQRKLNGGRIISGICTPHIMVGGAGESDIPGNPNIAPEPVNAWNWQGFDGKPELGAKDFLIVANPSPFVEEPHNRGCFVLGVGFPMTTNRYSPLDFNDHPNYFIEDMSDIFIYTWGPKEDGLITPTLTPHMKILPTSPMTVVAYWLIMAQLAHNLAYEDTSGTFDAAETYIDILMARLQEFHSRFIGDINEVGEIIAERILDGGKIYPWSGRNEFWLEANGTAGSLMGFYRLIPDSLTAKDIVIIAAADSTPVNEIEMARKAREKGAYIIGIFPFEREDGYSTEPFKELCDLSLDNLSGDIYGVLDIPGYPNKIIPTTTMMNNFAFWPVMGAYVQAMERRGEVPYFWSSFHVPKEHGGRAYADSIRPYFLKRGY